MKSSYLSKSWLISIGICLLLFCPVLVQNAFSQNNLEAQVDEILSQLSLEEKVALCHAQSKFSSAGVPRLGIPELWYSDGPHGVRAEILWDSWDYAQWTNDSCTAFPALTCLAATFDPSLAYQYGLAIGQEARYRKKDVLLGPGVNIYRHPLNGRNFEYLGEDPFLSASMVKPYIQGVQENGVAACVKHFALNNQEIDRGSVDVEVSERALREIYLPAFKAAVDAGVWSLMGSYNRYLGEHCCQNEVLLNRILKNEWQFDGAVISDWGGVHNTEEAAAKGMDIEMGTSSASRAPGKPKGYGNNYLADDYLEGLRNGQYSIGQLDDKARRVLRLMLRTNLNCQRPFGSLATEEHAQTGRAIGRNGIVLLKNEHNILPLRNDIRKIAVIGENATRNLMEGGGSSELKPKHIVTPLQALKERYPEAEISYAQGYDSGKAMYNREGVPTHHPDSLLKEAVQVAGKADIVIYVGGLNKNHKQDCEDSDRASYELPFGQVALIEALAKANPQTVVVLIGGNAVETSWSTQVPALLQAWYGGSEAGHSLVDILSGDFNPSGKLPFSFPKKIEDNGAISYGRLSYPGIDRHEVYKEDILVGYRWHDTKKIPAAWPFGYGLSYTGFQIGACATDRKSYGSADTVQIRLSVKNIGERDGAEVIQVYLRDPKCSVPRPYKELKAFKKVFLKAGEEQLVQIAVPVESFAFYQNGWIVEEGEYQLLIGNSSTHIVSRLKISVK